jgi:hypothetical protein
MSLLWKTSAQCLLPVIVLAVVSVWLIWLFPGTPRIHSIPTGEPSAPFVSGMFDVRSVGDGAAYTTLINERYNNGYRYNGSAMSAYQELPKASRSLLPFQAKLVGWGRLSAWGLFFPDRQTYAVQPLTYDYKVRTGFLNPVQAEKVRTALSRIMQETGEFVQLMEKKHNPNLTWYNNNIVPRYNWFYRVLFLFAIAGWLIGLSERKYLASVLMIPFLLNIVLHVYMLNVSSEQVQSFDIFLWMAAICGLVAGGRKSLQKATDEGDRRCMAPIRPKRLLTRYEGIRRDPHVPLGRRVD